MARIDRLESGKELAQIGAVIGREFSHELLARLAGLPEAELREKVRRLLDAGLLISRRSRALRTYAFRHETSDAIRSIPSRSN